MGIDRQGGFLVPPQVAMWLTLCLAQQGAHWAASRPKPAPRDRALWLDDLRMRNSAAIRWLNSRARVYKHL
jgi:hypothetical protein